MQFVQTLWETTHVSAEQVLLEMEPIVQISMSVHLVLIVVMMYHSVQTQLEVISAHAIMAILDSEMDFVKVNAFSIIAILIIHA